MALGQEEQGATVYRESHQETGRQAGLWTQVHSAVLEYVEEGAIQQLGQQGRGAYGKVVCRQWQQAAC